jgi:hypothetical protein
LSHAEQWPYLAYSACRSRPGSVPRSWRRLSH